jgi:hypothetical protein
MQLLLSFALEPTNETEQSPDLWSTLPIQHRSDALDALARLLAKTTTEENVAHNATEQRKDPDDD